MGGRIHEEHWTHQNRRIEICVWIRIEQSSFDLYDVSEHHGHSRYFLLSCYLVLILLSAAIFLFYAFFSDAPFTPQAAFTTLSLINLLRLPFFLLPFSMTLVQQYSVTFKRVQEFVTKPDLERPKLVAQNTGKGGNGNLRPSLR